MKSCNKCGINKPLNEYSKHKKNKDGLQYSCKMCVDKYNQQYRKKHREKIIRHKRQDYRDNKEKRLEQKKQQYIKHKKKIITRCVQRLRNKRNTNSTFKITCNLRKRVSDALCGKSKSDNTTKLLGCNCEYLRGYLETQFTEGMSWDNYGEWHVDHKIPCASFNLSIKEEQRKCFHYTNLQPLWAIDNLKKSNKVKGNYFR